MNTLYLDSTVNDDVRRQRLYNGELFVFSPRPSSLALCQLTREMIEEAFALSIPERPSTACRSRSLSPLSPLSNPDLSITPSRSSSFGSF